MMADKVFQIKVLDGIEEKTAKKISKIRIADGVCSLEDPFGIPVARLKLENIKDATFESQQAAGGILKKPKELNATRLQYVTKSGESRQLVLACQVQSEAWSLHSALAAPVSARKAAEKREQRAHDFLDVLEAIPRAPIGTEGEKGTIRATEDFINHLTPSNITARPSYATLGDYVALDLETGGLKSSDPVLEVAAIRFDGYEPAEIFTTLIDPGRPIDPEATAVNGITDDMVHGFPTIWQVMPSLADFIGASSIVAHNVSFDLKFLYRYGLDLKPRQKVFDTVKLSQKAFKDVYLKPQNYKLATILDFCGLPYPESHRAAADALAVGILFRAIAEKLASES